MGKLRVVSLFAGCGGTDIGLLGGFNFLGKKYAKNAVKIVFANEVDEMIAAIFKENFKINFVIDNIKNIKSTQIPDHDILTGGFPCQSFSIVAQNPQRLGFKDENGKLFFEMCRILRGKKPKAFIAENVKGILSANNHQAFPLIIKEFEKCGYIVAWYVLNAANYGIPQKRERVFIVGIKKSIGRKFFPPEPTHNEKENKLLKQWVPLRKVIFPHNEIPQKYFFSQKAQEGLKRSNPMMNKGRVQDIDRACNTVGSHLAKVSLNSTDPVLKVNGDYRRFTPREVARIQSFPDTFILTGPETIQYKALGNAIPPVLMWHITRKLIKLLEDKCVEDVRTLKEKRSFNMSKIKSKNTSIEVILSQELSKNNIKHQRNLASLPGKPDIVIEENKLAIFCDSGFWHGRFHEKDTERIITNKDFWKAKIERNIYRDKRVNQELKELGWKVLRFWDDEIKNGLTDVIIKIINSIG